VFWREILQEARLRLTALREELARSAGEKPAASRPKETFSAGGIQPRSDAAALEGQLDPLVGRDVKSSASSRFSAAARKIIQF